MVKLAMRRSIVLVMLGVALGFAVAPSVHRYFHEPQAYAGEPAGPSATALSPEEVYARAATVAGPSVVNIDTVSLRHVQTFFFEDAVQRVATGGSGVIISSDGDIITNEHVVANAEKITVTLHNGQQFAGRVIGRDRSSDVALVKIDGRSLPAAKVGTSRGLIPGQITVAIGNPLGLRFTVTHGIVSALGRPIKLGQRVYENLIQTDCAINPGNSGGALVDREGRLIGINTLVADSSQGIGFAIPVDTAMRIVQDLRRYGKVKRPWTGMYFGPLTSELRSWLDLGDSQQGAIVEGVAPGSPADAAGIVRGDVVVEFDGRKVVDDDDLRKAIQSRRIGQKVSIVIVRDRSRGRGELTLTEAP